MQSLRLQSFVLHFMQSRHSYLPNDADFGVIERAIETVNGFMYIPQQWMEFIRKIRRRQPFTVVEIQGTDFVELDQLAKQFVNRKKASDGTPVKWLQIKSMSFTASEPQVMKYKYICDDDAPWSEVDFRRGCKNIQKEQHPKNHQIKWKTKTN